MTSRVEAFIFDWGGTLTPPITAEGLEDMWRPAARRLAPEREDELASRLLEIEARFWARVTTDQRSFTLDEVLVAANDELGLDLDRAALGELAVFHLDRRAPHIQHDPAAASILAALRRRGFKIGILSNTHWPSHCHQQFLERDGAELVDAQLYTSDLPYMKPHPSAFRAALDALAVSSPHLAAFVGDRPWDDIHGAKQCGLKAVLVRNELVPGHDGVVPDAVVRSLADLIQLVDEWMS